MNEEMTMIQRIRAATPEEVVSLEAQAATVMTLLGDMQDLSVALYDAFTTLVEVEAVIEGEVRVGAFYATMLNSLEADRVAAQAAYDAAMDAYMAKLRIQLHNSLIAAYKAESAGAVVEVEE